MNILVINYRDRKHPAAGGAEKHLHRIFSRIVSMGHKVVLLTTSFPGAESREAVDGIQVIRQGGDLLFQWTVARSIKALDREFNFDIVVEDLNKLPVFAPYLLKKPVLVQMHHLWRSSIFSEASFPVAFGVWFFERIIPWFYKKQQFVVVSPSTESELNQIGVSKDRISVIYNGSDPVAAPEVTQTVDSRPYFLWLSRIHKYKGIWTALEAFEKFAKRVPAVDLVIAGDGPLMKKIPSWLKSHGLANRVKLCGFVSSGEKYRLMAGALAMLQTSYKEGWGLTVIEAAQLKVPTVASDVPGLRDSVRNGKTGLLFPVKNAAKCAEAMERICSDEDMRKSMGWAAKQYASTFSWDEAAAKTMDLLQRIVDERGRS